uniref:Uncharacterized protein n=1 Tax=Oryza punctata TaxID=4537 RepID=A0A0E0KZS0_ORYPU
MNTTGRPQSSHYSIELLTRTIHIMARRRRLKIARDRRRKLQSAMAAPRTLQRKICDGNNDNKKQPAAAGVVRVKVVLTRKQAARLVSLAGEGRRRTAVQLVRELRRMEDAGRVDGSSPATAAWRPVLETISEE